MICLNKAVLDFMASKLTPASSVLEFGAGGSTRWFAERCAQLLSVETSAEWAHMARESCRDIVCNLRVQNNANGAHAVDLVLVDSVWKNRDADARIGWSLLKSGGWLVFDDAQRERHGITVAWLSSMSEPIALRWSDGDIETAKDRLALAWRKE